MIINDIQFQTKDGRPALLRNPREEDIPGALDYLIRSAEETEYLLRYPEESGNYTYADEQALFEKWNASANEVMLMCLVDGKVVGTCHLLFKDKIKTRHRAVIAIGLLKEYWNLGLGTRMMQAMIDLAEAREGILQMELEVIEGNTRAIRLYEKVGFRIAGIHPRAIRLRDGTLLNEFLMIRTMQGQCRRNKGE